MCASFIAEWMSGKDLRETVDSLRRILRLFGTSVYHCLRKASRRQKKEGVMKSEREEKDGQGINLHSEAQIDAKQLLNSCKVEQLLGRQEERDGR